MQKENDYRINLYEEEETMEEEDQGPQPYDLIKEDLKNTFYPRSLEEFHSYVLGLANLACDGATLGHISLKEYKDEKLHLPCLEDYEVTGDFYKGCGDWDVSMIKDFEDCFSGQVLFNEDLNKWKMDQARNINFMLAHCRSYDKPLLGWKLDPYVTAHATFYGTSLSGKIEDIIKVSYPDRSFTRQTFANTKVKVKVRRTIL